MTATGGPIPTLTDVITPQNQGGLPNGSNVTWNNNVGLGTGTLTGKAPTASGSYSVATITATNGVGSPVSQVYTLVVGVPPAITSAAQVSEIPGSTFSFNVTTSGSPAPSLSATGLPAGVTFVDNGSGGATLSGTAPSTLGNYPITISASNDLGTATQNFTLIVSSPPTITTTTLATANAGQTGYSQPLAATGGTPPYTWSISSGTLPSGLSIGGSTGVISGNVSSTAVTQTFTVKVTDAGGLSGTKSFTLTVNAAPIITTGSLPAVTKTGTYSQTLSATGGTTPYTWLISSGTLPSGLTIGGSTGTISGTVASTAATQTFTVQVTGANGASSTKSFTLTVNAVPNITTTSLPAGTNTGAYSQTLGVAGGTTPLTWSLASGVLPSGLTLGSSSGAITGTITSTAISQTFTVQVTDADGVSDTQQLTITVNGAPLIGTTSLAVATAGQTGYSQTLSVTGGTTPYTWSITVGSLPAGLSLNSSSGIISGNVSSSAVTKSFTVQVKDANGATASLPLTLTVNPAPNITTSSLPGGTRTGTYSQTLAASGGTAPLVWSVSSGNLPTGLTLGSTGVISGTISGTASSQTFTLRVTDANGVSDTQSLTITVNGAPNITTTSLPAATKTGTYSQTLGATGGTTPYTWSVAVGTLPTGLSLSSSGVISGTVSSTAINETFTVKVTDSDGVTDTQSLTIAVNATPSITTVSLPAATKTGTYSQTLTGTGGTTPYTWSISSGTLPGGLTLSTSGVISGTVTGSVSQTFTVQLSDADGVTNTQSLTITVNAAPTITTTSLPAGTRTGTYSQTLAVTGGTTPFTWSITSGALPTGLSLSSSGVISGAISGTTSGTFTVRAADANGASDTQSLTITVNAAPNITTTTLPGVTKTANYNQTLAVTGGTTPFTWSITTGVLPAGLTLSGSGVISGTASTSAVNETFTVKATDANGVFDTQSLSIAVNPLPLITVMSLATATNGQVGYSQTLAATGGTTPYTWSITSGVLPAGLTLGSTNGVISGTVSGTAVSETFTVQLTDTDGASASLPFTITVNLPPSITTTSLPAGTKTAAYSQTLSSTGGTTPIAWTVSTGTLPNGLNLGGTTGIISGTISNIATSQTFTVRATDSNGVSDTQSLTITVNAVPNIATTTLPGATKSGTYSQTVTVTGGTAPFAWSITTGVLPTGLTFNTSSGVISGTIATTAVSETFTVKVVDSYGLSDTQQLTIAVNGAPTVTTATLPAATKTGTYSQTLSATGGTTPYAWSLSAGALPAGLNLSSGGVISGTVGTTASTQTFTVQVADADGVTATQSLTITVNAAPTVTTVTLPGGQRGKAYSQTLAATGGTTPYTWSVSVGSLPTGLTLNASTGAISGTVSNAFGTNKTWTFTVKVTDVNGASDTQQLSIVIS